MHFLITGHTGFKGSWLAKMLEMQGHTVSGISLPPIDKSLFLQANIKTILKHDIYFDLRDSSEELSNIVQEIDPEVIVHLAAQPLVGQSYINPIETFDTNIKPNDSTAKPYDVKMGTHSVIQGWEIGLQYFGKGGKRFWYE